MFECVINLSEGRDLEAIDDLSNASSSSLRDLHYDVFHNRSVFTLINDVQPLLADVQELIGLAFDRLNLAHHEGVHPRFGVVDVVPFVALDPRERRVARELRDSTGQWVASTFAVPVFFYGAVGPGIRTLPEVRRGAFTTIAPDLGPAVPSPTRGAVAIGERRVLVAWNLWLRGASLERARHIAAGLRGPAVRALAFRVGEQVQVSCNLVEPEEVGPSSVYDRVLAQLSTGEEIDHAELVGLAPRSVLLNEEPARWNQLGLSEETTIERRLA